MIDSFVTAVRRLIDRLLALVPGPPSREPAAPDIDGRRTQAPDTTAIEMETLRKDGHGGYR